jgi:hypothetical protein
VCRRDAKRLPVQFRLAGAKFGAISIENKGRQGNSDGRDLRELSGPRSLRAFDKLMTNM